MYLRSKIAIVLAIVGLVVLALGIGQRTIWLPPATVTAGVEGTVAPSPLTVIGPDVLKAKDGNFTMTIKAKGPIQLAVAQQRDITGWVGDAAHTDITGVSGDFASLATRSTPGTAKVPNPAGSDMWVSEEKATGELSYTWQAPGHGDWALLVSSDGTAPAPTDISITADNDAATPWAVPLMIIGSALLALAALLFFIAPRTPRAAVAGRRSAGRTPGDPATGAVEVEKILAARERAARAKAPQPATIADARRAARRREAAAGGTAGDAARGASGAAAPGGPQVTDHATALPGAVLGSGGSGPAGTAAIDVSGTIGSPGTGAADGTGGGGRADSGQVPGAGAGQVHGADPGQVPGAGAGQVHGADPGQVPGAGAGQVHGAGAGQVPGAGAGTGKGGAQDAAADDRQGRAKKNAGKDRRNDGGPSGGASGDAGTPGGASTKAAGKGNPATGTRGKPAAGKDEFSAAPTVVRPQPRRGVPAKARWGAALAAVLVAGTMGPAVAADPTTPAATPAASPSVSATSSSPAGPSATSSATGGPSAGATATTGATAGLPVLLDSQVQRITAAVSTVVASGDNAKNAKELESRVAGMALQIRAANYKIRSKVAKQAAVDPVNSTKLLARVVTTESAWPRPAVVVTKGDGNALPQLLTLVQASPRTNYKLVNATPLLPGQTFPAVNKEGAANVPLESAAGLQMSPKAAIAALSDRMTKADSKWKSTFKDSVYIPSVLNTQAQVLKEAKDASYVFSHTPDVKTALAMRTADGGAMVVVGYTFGIDATSKADATLTIGADAAAFTGGTETTKGFVLSYAEPVVMYIPPADAKGQIGIVSANRNLVGAKFK